MAHRRWDPAEGCLGGRVWSEPPPPPALTWRGSWGFCPEGSVSLVWREALGSGRLHLGLQRKAVSLLPGDPWRSGMGSSTGGPGSGLPVTRVLVADSLRVREDEDNLAVIHAAQDALRLIQNKFLPAVSAWVQVGWARAGGKGALGQGGCLARRVTPCPRSSSLARGHTGGTWRAPST